MAVRTITFFCCYASIRSFKNERLHWGDENWLFYRGCERVMLQSGDERTVVPPGGDHLKSEII